MYKKKVAKACMQYTLEKRYEMSWDACEAFMNNNMYTLCVLIRMSSCTHMQGNDMLTSG